MDFNREEDKSLTSTSSIRTWDLWVQCFKLFHSGPEKTTDAKFIFAKEVNESFYSLKKNRVEDISFPAAVLGRRQHPKNGSSTAHSGIGFFRQCPSSPVWDKPSCGARNVWANDIRTKWHLRLSKRAHLWQCWHCWHCWHCYQCKHS